MTVRACLPWPDPRLRTPARAVAKIDETVLAIWTDMVDTMEAMPGVGLAAPQIGVPLRLAVVDASIERGQAIRLANPEIVWASDDLRAHDEASPNLPGISARVERPRAVRVRHMDATGATVESLFEELWSTSVQHQIDHLNGMLFVDRLSRVKRDMLLRKAGRIARGG